jgi:hypothetical protein
MVIAIDQSIEYFNFVKNTIWSFFQFCKICQIRLHHHRKEKKKRQISTIIIPIATFTLLAAGSCTGRSFTPSSSLTSEKGLARK